MCKPGCLVSGELDFVIFYVIYQEGDAVRNFMQFVGVLLGIMFLSNAVAAEKEVVIPADSAKKKLVNVVRVSSAGGGDFSDPLAAVDSITDAAAGNQYLVEIGPGVYTLTGTLVMKPYVTIAGAGSDATTLTGAVSTLAYDASSAVVSGADNATLRDLTVTNTGGGAVSIVLYNENSSPVIENAILTATGGRYNYAVYNVSSEPTMTEVTATASGGLYNYDVLNASPPRAPK